MNPDRVRIAREAEGLTQVELAARLQGALTGAAISQIESGKSRPSSASLEKLAAALRCPPEYFVQRETDSSAPGFFRSLRTTTVRVRRQALAQAYLIHDFAAALEEYARLPRVDVPKVPFEIRELSEVEDIAAQVRADWQLENDPILNVVRTLERRGIVTVRVALERADIDAFSVPFETRPVVVLGNDKGVAARSRFDAAHELGHLVMHDVQHADTKAAEDQAHRFAAAFLMPRDVFVDLLPSRADWRRLIDLKVEWGVSLASLLYRAKTLGIMSDHTYVSAVKTMSVRGWRKLEPGDDLVGRPERPALLSRAMEVVAAQGLSIEDIAVSAGLPLAQLRRLVDRQDPRPAVEL